MRCFGTVAGLVCSFSPGGNPSFCQRVRLLLCRLCRLADYDPHLHSCGAFLWNFMDLGLDPPAAALIYILATILSAWQYSRGKGGQWKGRSQAS